MSTAMVYLALLVWFDQGGNSHFIQNFLMNEKIMQSWLFIVNKHIKLFQYNYSAVVNIYYKHRKLKKI